MHVRTHASFVWRQDLCRRACQACSTQLGIADVPGLDLVNNNHHTPLMAAIGAGNEVMALELVPTSVGR